MAGVFEYDDSSFPLHNAIVEDILKHLESLLCNPNIDINLQDECGRTPLFLSLEKQRSNSFIKRLVQAGCDVNISNETNITPLHLAISSSSNEIAHELIKRSAEVNMQEDWATEKSLLHVGVEHNNLEGVCLLLYYGAEVYIIDSNQMTPFHCAARKELQDIVEILVNYYDESYYNTYLTTHRTRFWPNCVDVEHEGTVLLQYSMNCRNTEFAKLLWNKINFESILNEQDSNFLLVAHIEQSCFSTSIWLDYLYLILNIFLRHQFRIRESCICNLLYEFHERNVQATTRLGIINMCLSLGAPVREQDFEQAFQTYGFGEELEALIYGCNYITNGPTTRSFICFILGLEEDFSIEFYVRLFHRYWFHDSVSYFIGFRVCLFHCLQERKI